jgi:hypothetical protein
VEDRDSAAQTASSVPGVTLLKNWAALSWDDGVRISDLDAFDRVKVWTRNSLYEIVVLTPSTCEVLIRGGRFFPTLTRAHVAGCSLGGSFLKLYSVHPGFCLEIVPDTGPVIVTTRVHAFAVSALPAARTVM